MFRVPIEVVISGGAFLYTEVCMAWSDLGEHLVYMNEILPPLPGASIMDLM